MGITKPHNETECLVRDHFRIELSSKSNIHGKNAADFKRGSCSLCLRANILLIFSNHQGDYYWPIFYTIIKCMKNTFDTLAG